MEKEFMEISVDFDPSIDCGVNNTAILSDHEHNLKIEPIERTELGNNGIEDADAIMDLQLPPVEINTPLYDTNNEHNLTEDIKSQIISEVSESTLQLIDAEGEAIQGGSTTYSEDSYFEKQTLIELSRHSWGIKDQNYLRGCVWSPDGTCVLAPVNRDGMHVLELPTDLYTTESVSPDRPLDLLQSAVHIREGGSIYDYCWYPYMNSGQPESCW